MLQKAKANELERKANMKRASLTEQERGIDLAKDYGCNLAIEYADDVARGSIPWAIGMRYVRPLTRVYK
jgi:hypothetical protein